MRHTSMNLTISRTRIAHSIIIAVYVMIPFCVVNAQIDGDNIFSVDQIISIDLAFPQDDFWGICKPITRRTKTSTSQPC